MFPGRLQVTGIIRKKTKQKQRCALLGCRGSAAYPDCGPRDGPLWAVQFRVGFAPPHGFGLFPLARLFPNKPLHQKPNPYLLSVAAAKEPYRRRCRRRWPNSNSCTSTPVEIAQVRDSLRLSALSTVLPWAKVRCSSIRCFSDFVAFICPARTY